MRGRSLAIAAALTAVTSIFQACTTRDVVEVDIASVAIEPATPIVTGGATVQLSATVSDEGGTPIPQAVVEWSSEDEEIASVDETGRVSGRSAGTTMIRASFRSVSGTAPITVQPGPFIGAIPDSVTLFGTQTSPPSAVVQIANVGVGTLSGLQAFVEYEGTASGWLPITLAGSTAPTTLTLTAVTSGLSVGSYRALVRLGGIAENSPLPIPVNLTVTENQPIIRLTPSSLTIQGVQGQGPGAPAIVQVTNVGGGVLTGLSTSVWYAGSTAGWLSATLQSTTAPTQMSVLADARALAPGTHRGEVRVASPGAVNDPEAISVTFVVTAPPPAANVSVRKSGPASAQGGSRITYSLLVANAGPDPAAAVVVVDTLPSGMTFVSATGGTHSNRIVNWSVGSLANGASRSIDVVVDIAPATVGNVTNRARVASATADPSVADNLSAVTTAVTAAPSANLVVGVSAPSSDVAATQMTLTATVANLGASAATAVVLRATLPAGTTFVSATGGGTHAAGVVTWSLGTLTVAQGTRSFSVVVAIAQGTTGNVTSTVSATATTLDPNLANNTASAVTFVLAPNQADVSVTVTGPATASGGQQIRYDVTVTNHGPAKASDVVVTNAIPAQTTFVSATRGSFSNGVVAWSHKDINSGSSVTTSIYVRVAAGASGNLTDTAVASTGTTDPIQSNNTGQRTTSVSVAPGG